MRRGVRTRNPRQGWDEQFVEMARRGDDKLLDSEAVSLSSWDKEEWEPCRRIMPVHADGLGDSGGKEEIGDAGGVGGSSR